ncbi:MAG: outer membrane beta-barrel protein, partial [Litorimonas sp.]
PCTVDPCAGGSYAVSPYAPAAQYAQTPDAHAYGSHAPAYHPSHSSGLRGPHAGQKGHFYGTLGAVWQDVGDEQVGLEGRLGYHANEFFGAELEASVGLTGETTEFDTFNGSASGGEFEEKVDHSVAVFATGRLPLSDVIQAHARVGYHNTKTSTEFEFDNGAEFDFSDTQSGVAYGAGLQYDVTPVDGIRLDYTRYEGGDGRDAVSLAWLRRF